MNGLLLSLSILAALPAASAAPASSPAVTTSRAPTSAPARDLAATVILVVGAPGTAEYGREFATWADRWRDAAGRASTRVIEVGRDGSPGAPSDKQRLQTLLADESAKPSDAGPLWLVLIGHGTFDGREAKFNLRADDVAAGELAKLLGPVKRPLAVINCSSASAPFVNRLSGEGRVIVTATRSGSEVHYARFGEYLSAAITDPAADIDKDGQTSLLEAFGAASHRTEEFYKQQGRLATEHALLDDNGDALGTPAAWFQGTRATRAARDGAAIDGTRAHQWHLVPTAAEVALPADLRARRDQLELEIESLRARKATMSETEYYAQLERLLLQLARIYNQPAN